MRPPRLAKLAFAKLAIGFGALALLAAACGSSDDDGDTAAAPPPTDAVAAAPAEPALPAETASAAVKLGDADLGAILTGPDGMTLYGFTNDTEARSTCAGACALAWPPAVVGPTWTPGPGLDTGIFATTTRDDGQLQLVAGKWPLYYFEGDATPGDVNGQGAGDVWFAVTPEAALITDAPSAEGYGQVPAPTEASAGAAIDLASTELGDVVVDGDGRTLYAFTKDEAGAPTCEGGCATAWPAALAEGTPTAAEGIDASLLGTAARGDGGGDQLKLGKWPLYYFAGDGGPGETNGQGSGGTWFMVKADGTLVRP